MQLLKEIPQVIDASGFCCQTEERESFCKSWTHRFSRVHLDFLGNGGSFEVVFSWNQWKLSLQTSLWRCLHLGVAGLVWILCCTWSQRSSKQHACFNDERLLPRTWKDLESSPHVCVSFRALRQPVAQFSLQPYLNLPCCIASFAARSKWLLEFNANCWYWSMELVKQAHTHIYTPSSRPTRSHAWSSNGALSTTTSALRVMLEKP